MALSLPLRYLRLGLFALLGATSTMLWWEQSSEHELDLARQALAAARLRTEHIRIGPRFSDAQFRQYFIREGEDAVLTAEQLSRLRALVLEHHCELQSAGPLPSHDSDGIHYIGVRLEFHGDLVNVQKILHSIESARPLLFIEQVALRSKDTQFGVAPGDVQQGSTMLANLEIYGGTFPKAMNNLRSHKYGSSQ